MGRLSHLLLLLVTVVCFNLVALKGQSAADTINQSVWVNYSGDIQIEDTRFYSTQQLGYKRSNGRETLVATATRKVNPYLKGTQFGLDYYRSWRGGYFNLGGFYSASKNFPSWVAVAEGYFKLPFDMVLRLGGRYIKTDDHIGVAALGVNKYVGNLFLGYTYHLVTNQSSYHTGFIRYYLSKKIQLLELAMGSGLQERPNVQQVFLDQRLLGRVVVDLERGFSLNLQAGASWVLNDATSAPHFIFQLGLEKSF